jgi:hypothetical protein
MISGSSSTTTNPGYTIWFCDACGRSWFGVGAHICKVVR